jgi:hypothetical protein
MKLICFLLIMICIACNNTSRKKNTTLLQLKYSAYVWQQQQNTNEGDFHLLKYFHVNNLGRYCLLTNYLEAGASHGFLSDSLDLKTMQLIDSILIRVYNQYHRNSLNFKDTFNLVYNGPTSYLDCKLSNNENLKIKYIKNSIHTPTNILFVDSIIEQLFNRPLNSNRVVVSIGTYLDTLKNLDLAKLPSISSEKIKFLKPKN